MGTYHPRTHTRFARHLLYRLRLALLNGLANHIYSTFRPDAHPISPLAVSRGRDLETDIRGYHV